MEIILATQNDHKVKEVGKITGLKIKSIKSFKDIPDVVEDKKTYRGNSAKKAREIGKKLNKTVIADDSGFEVDHLKGAPGIFSARFMKGKPQSEKNQAILQKLKGVPLEKRGARFVCVASVYDPKTRKVKSFFGEVKGRVAFNAAGKKGFGYDPIFIPDGYDKTLGELGESLKNKISHRARAFQKLLLK